MMRKLLRTNGTVEDFAAPVPMAGIKALLGTTSLHVISLKDGIHVMIIDDWGATKGLPVNQAATAHYWEKCGGPVDWFMRGDAFICPDSDAS
jgi:hypothetical protein